MAAEVADQAHDVSPHQWLTTGQPQLAHALAHEGRTQPVQFLQRQHVGFGQEGHVLGHAIDAAKIATVRHRYAKIRHMASEGIDHPTQVPCYGSLVAALHSK